MFADEVRQAEANICESCADLLLGCYGTNTYILVIFVSFASIVCNGGLHWCAVLSSSLGRIDAACWIALTGTQTKVNTPPKFFHQLENVSIYNVQIVATFPMEDS